MELKNERRKYYQLVPIGDEATSGPMVLRTRRALVGSSESCDIVLDFPDINPIHAVLETAKSGFKVYDLNSETGCFVNGDKVITSEYKVGDILKFGSHEFTYKEFVRNELPPVLGMIDPILPPLKKESEISRTPIPEEKKVLPGMPQESRPAPAPLPIKLREAPSKKAVEEAPRVQYPLEKDPNAEFSEYIFEDTADLYPIFDYEIGKTAVEVAILYKRKIFSVDYLPQKNGVFSLVGKNPVKNQIEYVRLGKDEKYPFITVKNDEVLVNPISGYDVSYLSDKESAPSKGTPYHLDEEDILILGQGDIQIFVRKTDAPPSVKRAPIFSKDKDLNKFLILTYLLIFLFLGGISLFKVDKELEEEKAPERIATILYKKKPKKLTLSKAVSKTKSKPKKKIQLAKKAPKKAVVNLKPTPAPKVKSPPKIKLKPSPIKKIKPPKKVRPIKKARPNKGPKNIKKPIVAPKSKVTKVKSIKPSKLKGAKAPRKAFKPRKSRGRVDTYKAINFKSTIKSIMAKGGATKAVSKATSSSDIGFSGVTGTTSGGATLKTAKLSGKMGSLTGSVSGKLDAGSGVQGLVNKRTVYTAGIPNKTVVLGGMDPDVIRRILREHIPQFRFCYQKVLDRSSKSFSGVITMDFIIGASGHVAKAGVTARSSIPGEVKSCVVRVLRGIKFPQPLGGGIVEVNQPFNFYPTRK